LTDSATVSGLINNVPYLFRVAAVNLAGAGAFSANIREIPTAPVPDEDDELPELAPGEGLLIVDGQVEPLELNVVQDTILQLTDSAGGFAFALTSMNSYGRPVPLRSVGQSCSPSPERSCGSADMVSNRVR
jgi:hypothetical protein